MSPVVVWGREGGREGKSIDWRFEPPPPPPVSAVPEPREQERRTERSGNGPNLVSKTLQMFKSFFYRSFRRNILYYRGDKTQTNTILSDIIPDFQNFAEYSHRV